VRVLLSNAYAFGGTMGTVLNLAHFLAEDHEVEIISLCRPDDAPFYAFPPGCRVVVLEDRRPGARRPGAAAAVAPAERSVAPRRRGLSGGRTSSG